MTVPSHMKAMIFVRAYKPLVLKHVPIPSPSKNQLLIKIKACGVCRTDLHIVDGELDKLKLPLIPGHEIVGTVVAKRIYKFLYSCGVFVSAFRYG